ncbi:helix-turn-helix domain-containing protein [Pseudomonas sp. Pseusp122]|uniref:AraC family transcriptional regulator n=1 Tax=unclassified Pseudomonas TaxID=196821 RepID=UPI0039A5B144
MATKIVNMPREPVSGLDFDQPLFIYLRYGEFDADSYSDPHSHTWGQLNYASRGVMQIEVGGQRFLSPPQYGVWVPPGMEHSCYMRDAVVYRSVYIASEQCADFPGEPCTLEIGAILRAIFGDFAERDVRIPETPADIRLAQVLIDQLRSAPLQTRYLPYAQSSGLALVMQALQSDPSDNRTLAEWAQQVYVSERTLARQCLRELGMSFGDWRQRLRFLAAIEALDTRRTVQEIAFDMGYSSASAFIAMFQRQAGCTPEQYRRQGGSHA